jgi:hypothetical protein
MTRRTMAERKRRAAERATRRDALLVLLSRMQRGALLDTERTLLRAHVETELGEADELRRTVAGQQTAIQAAHDRTAAAEDAIREMEQRAVDAEEQLRMYRVVYGEGSDHAVTIVRQYDAAHQAAEQRAEAAERQIGILSAVDEGRAHGAQRIMNERDEWQQRAETAEGQLYSRRRTLAAVLARPAETPFDELTEYAALVLTRSGERIIAAVQRAEQAEAALAELAQALRLTREYVGEDLLPAVEGWSWYDALRRHAPRELGDTPELTPQAAAVHRAFVEAADSPRAQLDEQARAHAIELAEWKRRNANQGETIRDMGRANWEANARALAAEHRADRYRTAWFACRRDRRADRAAMAAELPLAQAVERVRALAARMRAGSPQGAAAIYADRIEQALAVDNEHQEQHV